MKIVAILMGILLCFLGACNALSAFTEPLHQRAMGGATIAIFFLLIGIPVFVYGVKSKASEEAEARTRKCPSCAEYVKPDAKVCPFCQRDIPAAA